MLAATFVVPCLSGHMRAPGSSGSGVVLGGLGRATLLCVYVVFVLLRYFNRYTGMTFGALLAAPDPSAESVDPVEDDAEVEAGVQKKLGLIDTMGSSPGVTSSITCCALLKTILTATDSTHRCNRMPRRSTVIHRVALLRSHIFGLHGT